MIVIDRTGHGKPLVLLHGVGASRVVWRRVIPELAVDRLVLVPDLPGLGQSAPVEDGFCLGSVADALADALSEQAGEPFDLVGNSLGGAVAILIAHRRPELVRRLVLVAPAGFTPRPPALSAMLGLFSGPSISLRRLLGTAVGGSASARRVLLWGTIAQPQRLSSEDARAMLHASRGSARIGAAVAAVLQADLRTELAELQVPLGLIWGERDRIIPLATLDLIRAVRPDVTARTIRDAAHVPQMERPGEFVVALTEMLDQL